MYHLCTLNFLQETTFYVKNPKKIVSLRMFSVNIYTKNKICIQCKINSLFPSLRILNLHKYVFFKTNKLSLCS